jgi:aspartyl-tRNA(Asn)/glutamyl-tRNA(Gln) amidotransferase subunit A
MTVDRWLALALADSRARGLPLGPLLEGLASSLRALRGADWSAGLDAGWDHAPAETGAAAAHVASTRRAVAAATPVAGSAPAALDGRPCSGGAARPPLADRLGTIVETTARLVSGDVSARDLTERCLAAIAARNAELRAFITITSDLALAQADRADRERRHGRPLGPLHGVPLSLKDLFHVEGVPTTAASRVCEGRVAGQTAPAVARLIAAGAVVVGKTNLHEFAFGTTSEESAYGPVRHPLDDTRSAGGSSGGSAAAVVAGMCLASIGTDTGGSVRIPSAACGIVGVKPTFGEVPIEGVVPLAPTLDHVGPLARSVADARVLLAVMRGDPPAAADATPRRAPRAPRGLRCGVLQGYFVERLAPQVRRAFELACARLREAGAVLEPRMIPHAELVAPTYLPLVFAEAAAYHARTLERVPDRYTAAVRLRLELARYVLGEDYERARIGRAVLGAEVDDALGGCDALLLPTLPVPATPLGASTVAMGDRPEPVRAATLRLTQLFNLTGHPAVSLPLWLPGEPLPCGLQLAGARGGTDALLDVAEAVELALR